MSWAALQGLVKVAVPDRVACFNKSWKLKYCCVHPLIWYKGLGASLFGLGWGMSGICPGPAIALIAFWPENLSILLLAIFAGSYAGAYVIPSGRDRRLAVAR